MKKLALIVCVFMMFSMVACTDKNGNGDNDIVEDTEDLVDGDKTDGGAVSDDKTDGGAVSDDKNNGTNGNGGNQKLTGKAEGYGGEVSVTVEVNGDDIVSVEAVGDKETQGIGSNAIDQLPDKIEEADSTDVDGVSGATFTSNAIKEAVDEALEGIK